MLRRDERITYTAKQEALPFQAEATLATRDLEYAALFHEQGLGKTKMALDLVIHWLTNAEVDSVMVVTKKGLVDNWEKESRFHTNIRPIILNQDRQKNFFAFNRPGRLYITHYEVTHSERNRLLLFAKARKLGVILDESQRIKNPTSRAAVALHRLSPLLARRVIMTGTPVANRPYDIWSQIFFLDQGKSLGESFEAFKTDTDLGKSLGKDPESTGQFEEKLNDTYERVRPFTVRKTKENADIELPEKTIRYSEAELAPAQEELYREYRDELAAEILHDGKNTLDDAEVILKRLLRLVQVASNPKLVDEGYQETPGKFKVLDKIIQQKEASGPKTIIWTSFRGNVYAITTRYIHDQPAVVHGGLSHDERSNHLKRFLEDQDCRLLVATPAAAKEGLTLTVANHAIFLDRSFSLDDYLQAQDRIHRITQTNECLIENIIATNTIDEWVGELLSGKELAARLLQGDIPKEEYQEQATYAFNRILQQILNPKESNK